ncbi:hypothetical protein THAOC_20687, partial [Thalassiosira oceanica]
MPVRASQADRRAVGSRRGAGSRRPAPLAPGDRDGRLGLGVPVGSARTTRGDMPRTCPQSRMDSARAPAPSPSTPVTEHTSTTGPVGRPRLEAGPGATISAL